MVFQLQQRDTRSYQYPDVQDNNFLGYDRSIDRWKVDASGIKLYASGISVELDKDYDSVSVWGASGVAAVETWINSPVITVPGDPAMATLLKRMYTYNGNNDIATLKEASVSTPSGNACLVHTFTYNANNDIDYIIESIGTW